MLFTLVTPSSAVIKSQECWTQWGCAESAVAASAARVRAARRVYVDGSGAVSWVRRGGAQLLWCAPPLQCITQSRGLDTTQGHLPLRPSSLARSLVCAVCPVVLRTKRSHYLSNNTRTRHQITARLAPLAQIDRPPKVGNARFCVRFVCVCRLVFVIRSQRPTLMWIIRPYRAMSEVENAHTAASALQRSRFVNVLFNCPCDS